MNERSKKMKKLMLVGCVLFALLVLSCEPESAIELIADVNDVMSDPNSSIQVTAGNLQEMITTGAILVKAVPGFPYAKAILGALAIAQAVLAMILGWQKQNNKKALKEVVRGNEILKKGPIDNKAFKEAQNMAQSGKTVEIVNKIRKNVA